MEGKSEAAWAYWDRLQELVGECGPYSTVANKTRLAFMVRVRFAGMDAVSDKGMTFSFWLKDRIESPRFKRIEHYGGSDWGYHVRVERIDDLDDEVQGWLCMAYQVGCQQA